MIKRIAMLSFHTCPAAAEEGQEAGGMNTYVLELSRALARQGKQVDIFTRKHDDKQPSLMELEKGLRIIHLDAGPQIVLSPKNLIRYLDAFVESFLSFGKPYDILHGHYYLSGLAALKIKQYTMQEVPLFLTFHTLGLVKNLVVKDAKERESNQRLESERLLVQKAQKIIAHSAQEATYLQDLYGAPRHKTCYVFPGVNLSLFKPAKRKKTKGRKLLFVGRIQSLKGIDCLLYALKMANAHSNSTLDIVGVHPEAVAASAPGQLKKIKELIHSLGLSEQVTFYNQCPQAQLAVYYQNADLLILPSLYESFGLVALEALACGTPAIVTENCGVAEFIKTISPKWVVSANNPLALAEAILANPKAPPHLSLVDWPKVAERVTEFYGKYD